MSETTTITMQPTKGLAELALSLRVAAAVAGEDATIISSMTSEEARTLAKAIEPLEAFSSEAATFHAEADQKIVRMMAENRKGFVLAIVYFVIAAALMASMWLS